MDENSQKSLLFCSLLALQFGLQPILASKFTASGVSKTSVVIATELAKIVIAVVTLLSGPRAEIERIAQSWTLVDSLKVAALPATLYAIQNLLVQYGYVLLDSMTFNLLNQTKVVFHTLTLSGRFYLLHSAYRIDLVSCVLVVGHSWKETIAASNGSTVHAVDRR